MSLTSGVLLSASLPHVSAPETETLVAPAGLTAEDLKPPPSALDIRSAIAQAKRRVAASTARSLDSLPEVPWTELGLAQVEVVPANFRFDEAKGRFVAPLADGRTAVLTLEPRLQRHLQRVVGQYREPGEAVVVIEPQTGRVLAYVDDATGGIIGGGLAGRAAAYAASTFKVITGAALLDSGKVTPETSVCYSGGGSGFGRDALTFNPQRDGTCRTFTEAMAHSSNIVFGRLAHDHLTPAALDRMASSFGFDQPSPFEVRIERSRAQIPTDDDLEFARAAAGFRHTWMTPLHGALIQAAIANNGVMMVPAIVDSIEGRDGFAEYRHKPVAWRTSVKPEVAAALRTTLGTTCTSGTARGYFGGNAKYPADVRTWGKTGTLSNRNPDGSEPDPFLTYTWFVGFGERDGRDLAAAGLVVNTPMWWIKGSFLAAEALRTGFAAPEVSEAELDVTSPSAEAAALDTE
jgi:cell division protein FtsI/penicillin-binding protein 2